MLKGKHGKMRKKHGKLFYSLIALGLVCVFVAAFFFFSRGESRGAFVYKSHETYIGAVNAEGYPIPEDIPTNDKFVTPKTKDGHTGVLDTGDYPTIPETDGGKKNKGTEENPFVILEIVPDMAQQSLAYMVSSQEEGLPYDPITVGIKISNNMLDKYNERRSNRTEIESLNQQHSMVNHGSTYVPVYNDKGEKTGDLKVPQDKGANTILNSQRNSDYFEQNQYDLPGWFANKITTNIYDPDGTIQGNPDAKTDPTNENDRVEVRNKYARLGDYYTIKLTSKELSLEDYADKSVADLNVALPGVFVDAENGDTPIRSDVIADEVNWGKNIELKKNYHFRFTTTDKVMSEADYKTKPMAQLVADTKYADVFKLADGATIPEEVLLDETRWVRETVSKSDDIELDVDKDKYIVFVPMGEGDYSSNFSYWSNTQLIQPNPENKATEAYIKYVDNLDDYPEYTYVKDDPNMKEGWQFANYFQDKSKVNELVGKYIKVSDFPNFTKVVSKDVYNEYVFHYDDVLYEYTYTYYNIKVNDLLKRMFFLRDSDKAYDDIKIKVIVATPDMINEVDSKDTVKELSYIERADMVYFSCVDKEAASYNWGDFLKFYYNYVNPEGGAYDPDNIASFFDNDLEWNDCMKLIERLSTEMNMPLMFTKQVGDMLNKGVNRDGSSASHLCLNSSTNVKNEVSSLNNIAKLYLITTQFNLGAVKGTKNVQGDKFDRTFMDDIFGEIKQVPLAKKDGSKNTAKYTGYFARQACDCGDLTAPQESNCTYLWNRYTFIPVDCGFDPNSNRAMELEKYGYLYTYLTNNNNLQSGNTTIYNKLTGVRENHDFDNDPQNVTLVGRDVASTLETLFNDSTMGTMGIIIYKIMNQGVPEVPTMQFLVEKYVSGESLKLKYTKISNDSVLLDYSRDAKYKNDRTLYLKCKLINNTYLNDGTVQTNIQDGVIRSVKVINQDTGSFRELIGSTTTIENGLTPSKPFDISDVAFSEEDGLELDADQGPISGIRVPAESSLTFWIPFSLHDWQNGWNEVEVTWVARTSKSRRAFQNEGSNVVTIGERGLFNLE